MKKTIGIISQRRIMARFYQKQLQELFSDTAEIYAAHLEEEKRAFGSPDDPESDFSDPEHGSLARESDAPALKSKTRDLKSESLRDLPPCDLYLVSATSYDLMRQPWAREYMPAPELTVTADVTFSRAAVELLHTYPEGTRALLINQTKHMSMECIAQFYHLGITNIEFLPCYPEIEHIPEADLAFVLGEPDLIPGLADNLRVVDIGSRLLSSNTITELCLKMGDVFFLESDRYRRYLNRLSNIDYALARISSAHLTAENKLEMILDALEEGIVGVDENNQVSYINKTARTMLGVSRSEVLQMPAARVLPELPFDKVKTLRNRPSEPMLLNIRDVNMGAVLTPITIQEQYLGAFFTLQSIRETEKQQSRLRIQLNKKGNRARSTFQDILGESPAIMKTKEIARHMAGNDAAVLIDGEVGTGKAMFAQAIHNESPRANGPFVTLGCAAFNDQQMEGELFGYAAGAFDGSTIEGKAGRIEQAHHGTLFLDGIETLGPRMQARLLRVLQEREIYRVGSSEAIPVDVRIISSTSEDLLELVHLGAFRRDLYYRLNVIPLHIPALRERRNDIPKLLSHFMVKLDTDFRLSDQARLTILHHRFEGNIRELQNCVEYLKYTGRRMISYEDLPEQMKERKAAQDNAEEIRQRSGLSLRCWWVMQELGEVYPKQKRMGRQAILKKCISHGNAISEHEVRESLKTLHDLGLADVRSGRGGTALTEEGYLTYRRVVSEDME